MTKAVRGFPAQWPVRSDDRRPIRYHLTSGLCRLYFRTMFAGRLRIEGEENIPEQGPLLLVSNHLSNLDPLLYGAFFPRTLGAMAKVEMFSNPLLAWDMAGCNVFPVDRGAADRGALRRALEFLEHGGRLLIFVEGTRARRAGMLPAEAGVGFLIRRSGARVLPAAVWGTEQVSTGRRLPRRAQLTVRYGTPFDALEAAGPGASSQQVAELVAARIAALLPEAYRGVHATAAEALLAAR